MSESVHDKFSKALLSERENAIDFLQNFLPVEVVSLLDLQTWELEKESFVDENLQEQFSDIIYRFQLSGQEVYIYTLLEHKSYPDRFTAFQVLKYEVALWDRHLKDHKKAKNLPVVLPLVLYHGKLKWPFGIEFQSLFSTTSILLPYLPQFRFLLYDLSQYSDSEIRGGVFLRLGLLLLKYIFTPQLSHKVHELLPLVAEIKEEGKGLKVLALAIKYLLKGTSKISLDTLRKVVDRIPLKGASDSMPTIAETLERKGLKKGRLLEKKRFDHKSLLRMALSLHQKGADFEFVLKMTELEDVFLQRFLATAKRLHVVV